MLVGRRKIRIVENGPVRVAIEVVRETEGSKFQQTVRLSDGDAGNRVEFSNVIDWKTSNANLKATFPLTAANRKPLTTGTSARSSVAITTSASLKCRRISGSILRIAAERLVSRFFPIASTVLTSLMIRRCG